MSARTRQLRPGCRAGRIDGVSRLESGLCAARCRQLEGILGGAPGRSLPGRVWRGGGIPLFRAWEPTARSARRCHGRRGAAVRRGVGCRAGPAGAAGRHRRRYPVDHRCWPGNRARSAALIAALLPASPPRLVSTVTGTPPARADRERRADLRLASGRLTRSPKHWADRRQPGRRFRSARGPARADQHERARSPWRAPCQASSRRRQRRLGAGRPGPQPARSHRPALARL